MKQTDADHWYCPQCGEPCEDGTDIHPECQKAFAQSMEDDRIEGDGLPAGGYFLTTTLHPDDLEALHCEQDEEADDRRAYCEEQIADHPFNPRRGRY